MYTGHRKSLVTGEESTKGKVMLVLAHMLAYGINRHP